VVEKEITHVTLKTSKSDPTAEAHIKNLRLFNLVFGRLKLEEWERSHIHTCEVCQGVLYVLVQQPHAAVLGNPERPDAA
jgi:hypothetical protein